MPNPTTSHDDEQTARREIETKKAMAPFSVGDVSFCACTYSEEPKWDRVEMEYVEHTSYSYHSDAITTVDIKEPDATKLVAMILQVFPNIRNQINESKP